MNDSASPVVPIVLASDLVGCRYRFIQRQRHSASAPTPTSLARAERLAAAWGAVFKRLPTRRALGDGRSKPFLRWDIPFKFDLREDCLDEELNTLEAIAAGANIMTGAVFSGFSASSATDNHSQQHWRVGVDILVRTADDTYVPIIVSNHRVASPHSTRTAWAIATNRLGLSAPLKYNYRLRHHVADGFRLALADIALHELGLSSGTGGVIGQDRDLAFLSTDLSTAHQNVQAALAAGWAHSPRRLKECASCRFWPHCESELVRADDISLVLPGDKAEQYRKQGIRTVDKLIDANLGEVSQLARAWREGIPLLARVEEVCGPQAEVEVDVDMESYLDQGAYLWGMWDGKSYRPFITWEDLGGAGEAENFARFWRTLMHKREMARNQGKSFAAYCYAANGENHWLRESARRFQGMRFASEEGTLRIPTIEEVEEFIASPEWVDVFGWVRKQLFGPNGVGLKVVAPCAGYTWADEDVDGEESMRLRRLGRAGDEQARARVVRYNADDTKATAAVRAWLRAGAPGVMKRNQNPDENSANH